MIARISQGRRRSSVYRVFVFGVSQEESPGGIEAVPVVVVFESLESSDVSRQVVASDFVGHSLGMVRWL